MAGPAVETAAVEVQGLVKRYGDIVAVSDLSLRAEAGTVTALLGPNGAGKTTTLEVIEGFRRADSGSVRVLGLDPARDGAALRPRVGVMLQRGGVYPAAKVQEMVRHVARLYAHPLDPAALMDRLGLAASARTAYRRLSGGQQQRLGVALAVVGRPELVVLDEPTTGLDPQARHATWDLVRQLREAGSTVLLTTHSMDEAERLADHVVIVDHGKVVTAGAPADLTSLDETVVRFHGPAGLDLVGLLTALPVGSSASEDAPGAYRVEGEIGPQLLATLTAWCAANGVMPRGLVTGHRSLEDVFLELTGRELR
ncbi:MAG: ABC transporter ATP-binding protein [Candidatus Nanopelagicales bacterium]